MEQSTAQTHHWKATLLAQGRSIKWLAIATETPARTIYAYSQRTRPTPEPWLAKVRVALGREVTP